MLNTPGVVPKISGGGGCAPCKSVPGCHDLGMMNNGINPASVMFEKDVN